MTTNKKKIFFGIEIVYNHLGQILLKKRFVALSTTYYFRYVFVGS